MHSNLLTISQSLTQKLAAYDNIFYRNVVIQVSQNITKQIYGFSITFFKTVFIIFLFYIFWFVLKQGTIFFYLKMMFILLQARKVYFLWEKITLVLVSFDQMCIWFQRYLQSNIIFNLCSFGEYIFFYKSFMFTYS